MFFRGSAGLPRGHGVGGRDPSRLVRRGRQALGDHCPRSAHFSVGGISIAESSILPWAACEEPSPFENPLLKIKLYRLVKRVRMAEGQRFTVSSPCSSFLHPPPRIPAREPSPCSDLTLCTSSQLPLRPS